MERCLSLVAGKCISGVNESNLNPLAGKKSNKKSGPSPNKKVVSAGLLALVLGFLTFLVYVPSISNDYALDDELVTQGHRLTSRGISAIPDIFDSFYYFDDAGNYYGYRPLVLVSFAIEHDLFGEDPEIGHGINVLLYVLTCVLVFLTLVRLSGGQSLWFPALATLIFALHPLHTEVVMSLKNRDEILGMLFVMLSFWAAFRFVDRKHFGYLPLVVIGFAFAMLSIPTIAPFGLFISLALVLFGNPGKVELAFVAIPIAFLTGFYLPAEALRFPVMLLFAALPFGFLAVLGKWKLDAETAVSGTKNRYVYWVAALGLLILGTWGVANYKRMAVQRGYNLPEVSEQMLLRKKPGRRISLSENPMALGATTSERLGTSFSVMGIYLKLHLLPYPLRYYYGYNQVEIVPVTSLWAILSLLVHLGLLGVVLLFWRRFPLLAFGLAWYLAGVLAASNLPLLMVGIVGERLVYPASLGFAMALAWLLIWLLKPDTDRAGLSFKGLSPTMMGALLVIIVGYSGVVVSRASAWEDRYALFSGDMPVLERSAKAHHLLATESVVLALESPLPQPEMVRQAHFHFMETVRIDTTFPLGWFDLGRLRIMMGDKEGALAAYERSVVVDTFSAESFMDLGTLYGDLGREKDALKMYLGALEIDKGNLALYAAVSFQYFKLENYDRAIQLNQQALKYFPLAFDPVANIGKCWLAKGDTLQAIEWFERALPLKPAEKGLRQTLNDLYQSQRDSSQVSPF